MIIDEKDSIYHVHTNAFTLDCRTVRTIVPFLDPLWKMNPEYSASALPTAEGGLTGPTPSTSSVAANPRRVSRMVFAPLRLTAWHSKSSTTSKMITERAPPPWGTRVQEDSMMPVKEPWCCSTSFSKRSLQPHPEDGRGQQRTGQAADMPHSFVQHRKNLLDRRTCLWMVQPKQLEHHSSGLKRWNHFAMQLLPGACFEPSGLHSEPGSVPFPDSGVAFLESTVDVRSTRGRKQLGQSGLSLFRGSTERM